VDPLPDVAYCDEVFVIRQMAHLAYEMGLKKNSISLGSAWVGEADP